MKRRNKVTEPKYFPS